MRIEKSLERLILIGILFYSGCIPVEDISGVWDQGFLDPDLEGHWKLMDVKYHSQDQYISFIKKDDVYDAQMICAAYAHMQEDLESKVQVRCLSVKNWGILVIDGSDIVKKLSGSIPATENQEMKEANLPAGGVDLYKIDNHTLCLYRLKNEVVTKAISDKHINGIVIKGDPLGSRIKKLDITTIEYLTSLANDVDNIGQVTKYERVQDLQKALKESKEYPATEKTSQNTLIDVNFPELKYFAEGKTHILLSQLQASPEWQVKDKNGEIICSRRTYYNGRWQGGDEGYESTFDEDIYDGSDFYQIRPLFRLSKEPYGFHAVWAKEDHVMKVGPQTGKMNLKLKLDDQGIMSYIAIGQEGLWFEFYEQRKEEARIHTQKALAWLKKFLTDVKSRENEILQKGYAQDLLPKNTIKEGSPSIEIQESPEGKYFSINAQINPQKSGYVYIKLFDHTKNMQQSAHLIKFVSNEFVGHSSNPKELFQYNVEIADFDNEWDSFNETRFELWFHPNDGGKEVKLIESVKRITGQIK